MSPEIIKGIFGGLLTLIAIYRWIFIVYMILSFFPLDENNFLYKAIRAVCDPLYFRFLRILPPLRFSMFDFSPIYVFIFLYILEFVIAGIGNMMIR